MRLRQLHADGDYTGLLELALFLNHEASYKNSGMLWAMQESLEANRPKAGDGGEEKYAEMVDITIHKLIQLKMQKAPDESKASLFTQQKID
jgi:hypothetical protein